MKSKVFICCDTETVGLPPHNLVYDLAYTIATRKTILAKRSFLVRETITDAEEMMGAFYAKKIFSFYIPELDSGTMQLYNWADVVNTLRSDIAIYGVDVFAAYNIGFDMGAIAATNKRHATGKVLEKKIDLLDLWTFACVGALNTRSYHNLAKQENWISEAGNVRTTAEKAYAFLAGQFDFEEQHTALDDALIETVIMQRLLARKKTIPYNNVAAMPWQLAQTPRGELI
jgi:hypothetical protein